VTLLAGELLRESKGFVDEGMNPQIIISGFRKALAYSLEQLKELAIGLATQDKSEERNMMLKCAATALNSKLLAAYKDHFSELVVQAIEKLDTTLLDKDMIGIKQITGGSVSESFLVDGVAFKKTFSYAGFEQQPKKIENPKIILLKIELELKAERDNAEIRI
jgi:T-complex protein 1 subunit eta